MRFYKSIGSRYLVILAHLGALITVTFWATSFLSTKVLMERGGFTPVEMYVYRFAEAYKYAHKDSGGDICHRPNLL